MIFDKVAMKKPPRNTFDLSHTKNLTCEMGKLIPIVAEEVMPGDTFIVNSELLVKFMPTLAPIMHKIEIFTHYFFVPYRLVWDQWEEFITGGEDGLSELEVPTMNFTTSNKIYWGKSTLSDYFGIPIPDGPVLDISADINQLPFRAYQLIWNEYYRDQNLQEAINIENTTSIKTLRHRNWERDYFTTCLPWAQKGEAITMPLGQTAPVSLDPNSGEAIQRWFPWDDYESAPSAGSVTVASRGSGTYGSLDDYSLNQMNLDPNGTLFADLTEATGFTIEELRTTLRIQEWMEKNARGGSRYIEQIWAHFGVKSSDARLQRPEYLGGGKNNLVVSEVVSMAETTENPQGNMSGHGVSVGKTNRFKAYFEEHGIVIGLMSIMPKTTYAQAMPKMFLRKDKFEYPWPEFSNLGEQEVLNGEVRFAWNAPYADANNDIFGYQARYADWKTRISTVHGDFRDTLDFWALSRQWDEIQRPLLNTSFISCQPSDRIWPVQLDEYDKIIVHVYNDIKAIRPLPYFGIPSII